MYMYMYVSGQTKLWYYLLTPPLFMVFGLPFGTSDCSKCSSSSMRRPQNAPVNTGNEYTLGAAGKEIRTSSLIFAVQQTVSVS